MTFLARPLPVEYLIIDVSSFNSFSTQKPFFQPLQGVVVSTVISKHVGPEFNCWVEKAFLCGLHVLFLCGFPLGAPVSLYNHQKHVLG